MAYPSVSFCIKIITLSRVSNVIFSMFDVSGVLTQLPKGSSVPVTLKVLEYELFHFCPLQVSVCMNILFFFLKLRVFNVKS